MDLNVLRQNSQSPPEVMVNLLMQVNQYIKEELDRNSLGILKSTMHIQFLAKQTQNYSKFMESHVDSLEEIREICIERDISTPELDEKIGNTIQEMY